jgi:hypothetical protein
MPSVDGEPLSADLLEGGAAIAEFVFGDAKKRRQVYHLVEAGQLPAFYLGAILCARKSTILANIAEREALKPTARAARRGGKKRS